MGAVDVAALAILAIAVLRGLLIGAIRESFSLAALAAASLAVRFGANPAASWLAENAPVDLGQFGAKIAAGALIAIGVVFGVAIVGRFVRRGARLAGLGAADRLAGSALGAAEGALVVGLLLLLGITLVGRDHPALADSRTLEAFEHVEELARGGLHTLPPIAAPGRDER